MPKRPFTLNKRMANNKRHFAFFEGTVSLLQDYVYDLRDNLTILKRAHLLTVDEIRVQRDVLAERMYGVEELLGVCVNTLERLSKFETLEGEEE